MVVVIVVLVVVMLMLVYCVLISVVVLVVVMVDRQMHRCVHKWKRQLTIGGVHEVRTRFVFLL